uniref:SCP domain-containing protein n=1 Tax=Mesocestoides corti TaxID=53468 RepID=A0A5K3FQH8_MESCO
MEALAVDWVSRCLLHYPNTTIYPQFNGTGQTLQAFASEKPKFTSGVHFAHEAFKYNYDKNICCGSCRNYKLVIRASATEVGCAMQRCYQFGQLMKPLYLLSCVFNNA